MERLSRKFLHNDDIRNSPYDRNSSLHYVWSAKEAMFKSYGKGQVDFQNHMRIEFKDDHLRGILNNEKDRISFELQHYYINDHYIVVALQQD